MQRMLWLVVSVALCATAAGCEMPVEEWGDETEPMPAIDAVDQPLSVGGAITPPREDCRDSGTSGYYDPPPGLTEADGRSRARLIR